MYISEFVDYITPDGLVYPLANGYDRSLLAYSEFGMPEVEYIDQRFPYGRQALGYNIGVRTVQLVYRRECLDKHSYWQARKELLSIMRPNRQFGAFVVPGKLRFRLPDQSYRCLDVIPSQGPDFGLRANRSWDEFSFVETLRFTTQEMPFWYDEEAVTVSLTTSPQDALVFPAYLPDEWWFGIGGLSESVDVQYNGDIETYPTITITGPLIGAKIYNQSTNETVWLDYTLLGNEQVVIDLKPGVKSVVNNLGQNLVGTVVDIPSFVRFSIAPDPLALGGLNRLVFSGSNGEENRTALSLSYKTYYIGV